MKPVGTLQLSYGGKPVDLSQPFERLTIVQAIAKYTGAGPHVDDAEWLQRALLKLGLTEAKNQLSTRHFFHGFLEIHDLPWRGPATPTPVSPSALSFTSPAASSAMDSPS